VSFRKMAFTSVDVESTGPDVNQDSVIGIGLVTMTYQGLIVDNLLVSLPVDVRTENWKHKSAATFWSSSSNQNALKQMEKYKVVSEKDMAHKIRTYLDKQWTRYGIKHMLLSNHSAYDMGFLNAILCRHELPNASLDAKGTFRKNIDVDSFVRGYAMALDPGFHTLHLPMNEIHRRLETNNPYPRNHVPTSDAAHTAYDFVSLMNRSGLLQCEL